MDHDTIRGLEGRRDMLRGIASQIWGFAEIKNQEYRSAALLKQVLRDEGFSVTENTAGLETAFIGEYGEGKPVIAFLGEYDALPGLSQEPCLTYQNRLWKAAADTDAATTFSAPALWGQQSR